MGWWSRGMIPPLQGGDQEFKSLPAHYNLLVLCYIFANFNVLFYVTNLTVLRIIFR